MKKSLHIESLAIHAGRRPDPTTGAVAQPLYLNTTFERAADGGYPNGYEYIRDNHPNRVALERTLAALESGSEAVAFASGSAATLAVFHCVGGQHIVASHDAYHGSLRQLQDVVAGPGTEISLVDTTSVATVRDSLREDTGLLWIETPSNPLMRISDIAALSQLVAGRKTVVAVDNTFATPILQNPLTRGADLVVHSTTKYIGGHSDVAGGAVIGNDSATMEALRLYHKRCGAVPSAFDCWLLQRSLATLAVRMRQHNANAAVVARFLDEQPNVERVLYAGLSTHPDHELAGRQMSGYGGMLSFCVRGGREDAMAVAARLTMITRATSLGGVESLIEHRASIEGPETRAPENLLRLSVGLEHADDLISDLRLALEY